MAPTRTHYDELEVSASASADTIRAAYRSLMQRVHPDRNPDDPSAAEHARRLNIAYEMLSDPGTRARYDAELRAEAEKARAREQAAARAQAPGESRNSNSAKPAESARRVNTTYGVEDQPAKAGRNENARAPTGTTRARAANPDGAADGRGASPAGQRPSPEAARPAARKGANPAAAGRNQAPRGRETQPQAKSAGRETPQPRSAAPRGEAPPQRKVAPGSRAPTPRRAPATTSRPRTRSILWPTVIVTSLAASVAGFFAWDYLEPLPGPARPVPQAVVRASPAAGAARPDPQPKSLHLIVTQECGGFRFDDAPVAYHECMRRKLEQLLREEGNPPRAASGL